MTKHKRPSLVDQVREALLEDLMSGTLDPGTKLPNENELADRFGVSRATIREAVVGLMDAGYLARRHGSGTYVTYAPRTRHPLETTVSYTAMIREAGHRPGETVLRKGARSPTELERKLLDIDEEDPVIEVERVRLADKRPVIYSQDRIPQSLLGELADDALDSSLYMILEQAGHPVARASAQLIPTVADAKLAKLLTVKRGTPLLHVDQIDYDERGLAVMLSHEWHVADAFELIVNRRVSAGAAEN
ncbi:MAG TPA: GntR family transcriptional regulator [Solirubrobacteraceae bacterium]|nr:GntR family transcriptional regulator [Solirubrobacteraceae bacterium]